MKILKNIVDEIRAQPQTTNSPQSPRYHRFKHYANYTDEADSEENVAIL